MIKIQKFLSYDNLDEIFSAILSENVKNIMEFWILAYQYNKALIIIIYSRNSKIWLKEERQPCYHWVYQNNNLQRMHILFSLVYIYFSVRWRWWCSIFSVGFASLITRKKIYLFLQLCSRSTFLKSCSLKVSRSIHDPNIRKIEISFWKFIPSFDLNSYFWR